MFNELPPNPCILFVTAKPKNRDSHSSDEELKKIQGAIDQSFRLKICMQTSPADFWRAIESDRPSVLHFSGHGDPEGLVLEEDGAAKILSIGTFWATRTLFEPVKLIVLSACHSRELAERITHEGPDCISMGIDNEVQDAMAPPWTGSFYESLVLGQSFEEALKSANRKISGCWPTEYLPVFHPGYSKEDLM